MNAVKRTWHTKGRRVAVETQHPEHGLLLRGWIRAAGVAETTGPGIAGTLTWALTDNDHVELDPVTGDYLDAERALLDATQALDA
jgi:hypothetical protein